MLRSLILALALIAPAAAEARVLYVTQRTLGHVAPDASSRVVVRANPCAAVNAVGRVGEWVQIETSRGGIAYMPIRALSATYPDQGPSLRLTAAPGVRQHPRVCS